MTDVHEYPDSGETVSIGEAGEIDRQIYQKFNERYYRRKMVDFLDEVFQKADNDPALKELLDKVVMYYTLKYGNETRR